MARKRSKGISDNLFKMPKVPKQVKTTAKVGAAVGATATAVALTTTAIGVALENLEDSRFWPSRKSDTGARVNAHSGAAWLSSRYQNTDVGLVAQSLIQYQIGKRVIPALAKPLSLNRPLDKVAAQVLNGIIGYSFVTGLASYRIGALAQNLMDGKIAKSIYNKPTSGPVLNTPCLLYTSDAADE